MITSADLDALSLPSTHSGGSPWRLLLIDMDKGRLIVPDYQRGRVWTSEQSARFMGYVLTGGQPPPIWVQEHADEFVDEVIDGLQRLTAFRAFMDGAVPAELPDGRRVFISDLAPDAVVRLRGLHINKMIVRLPTRADVLKLYLRLNRGGTVHTDTEIERVQAMLRDEERAAQ